MDIDFTKSKRTRGNRLVNGLFQDRKYIRGYVESNGEWMVQTWQAKNGNHIVWDDEDLALEPYDQEKEEKETQEHLRDFMI